MKEETVLFNPFRMLSPKLDEEVSRIEQLYEEPVQESVTLEHGLMAMISKCTEIVRLLSRSAYLPPPGALDKCEALAREVHEQEKMLTRNLVSSSLRGDVMKRALPIRAMIFRARRALKQFPPARPL